MEPTLAYLIGWPIEEHIEMVGTQRKRRGSVVSRSEFSRFIGVIAFVIAVLYSNHSIAQPLGQDHCNPGLIREELEATHQFPKLRGCDPKAVREALGDSDYGLQIEGSDSSNHIARGLIIKQRSLRNTVYVIVSTGPDRTGTGPSPVIDKIIGTILTGALQPTPAAPEQPPPGASTPPPSPQPSAPEPQPTPALPSPPPPVTITEASRPTVDSSAPAAPESAPKPDQSPPTTPQPASQRTPARNVASSDAKPAATAPLPAQNAPEPPPPVLTPVAAPPAPPVEIAPVSRHLPRFSIEGGGRLTEGDELELVIHRQGGDDKRHLLLLSYSDPSLLRSPPTSIEYGSDLPDEVRLRLATATGKRHKGEHDLAVTLVSANGAEVGTPDSVMAVILDRPPFPPRWALVLAAIAAAAIGTLGVVKFILPRAICSIGRGRTALGPMRLRSSWPSIHADTLLGAASFWIPHPLPSGRSTYAQSGAT